MNWNVKVTAVVTTLGLSLRFVAVADAAEVSRASGTINDATGAMVPRPAGPRPFDGVYVAAKSPADAMRTLDGLASGRIAKSGVSFGPCTLHPTPVRIRRDRRVGTKPYTKCSTVVTSIRHSTDMRYKFLIWWRLKGTKRASNVNQLRLSQKNVAYTCDSKEKTAWGSTMLGTIVHQGKTYYARIYPPRASLKCGG